MKKTSHGFSLAELLVSIAVLTLVVLVIAQLLNAAATTVSHGTKRMETESHIRPLFDRLSVDLGQMVKRADVSFYLKSAGDLMAGNDRMAFFSAVPGYYDDNQLGYNSGYSVISYRVNTDPAKSQYNRLERMAKGLPLNAGFASSSTTMTPLLFANSANPGSYTTTLDAVWPAATRPSPDPNYYSSDTYQLYELVGPQVFRFEYYYLTRGATPTLVAYPTAGFRDPLRNWSGANTINILDVSTMVIAAAVIDPHSKKLLSEAQLATVSNLMVDFRPGMGPGELVSTWQAALDTDPAIQAMPRPAIQGVRLYERFFYLSQ